MFIIFDASLVENLSNQPDSYRKDLLIILNKAADSMHDKNHYVTTINSDVAFKLYKLSKENDYALSANAFFYIYNNFSVINSLKEHLLYTVIIGKFSKDFEYIENTIRINYLIAKNRHFWDETTLIPEYSEDNVYFEKIIDYEKKKHINFLNVQHKYLKGQGGGHGNINNSFLNCIKQFQFVITILDTDKNSPDDNLGSTAKDFENDLEIFKYKNIFYYIPDIHEIENLFSSDGFLKLGMFKDDVINKIRRAESSSVKDANNFRAFLDIKNGYTVKDITDNPYLSSIFPIDYSTIKCPNLPCACTKKGCCKNELEGGTRTFLKNVFNNSLFQKEFNDSVDGLILKIKEEWFSIFKYLITTCCCNSEKIIGVN